MYVIGSQRELPSLLPSLPLLLMMIGFIIIIVSYRIASYHLLPLSRSLSPSLSLCLATTTAFNNNRAHLCAMLSRTRRRRLKKFKRITNFSAHLPPLLAPAPHLPLFLPLPSPSLTPARIVAALFVKSLAWLWLSETLLSCQTKRLPIQSSSPSPYSLS